MRLQSHWEATHLSSSHSSAPGCPPGRVYNAALCPGPPLGKGPSEQSREKPRDLSSDSKSHISVHVNHALRTDQYRFSLKLLISFTKKSVQDVNLPVFSLERVTNRHEP